MAAPCRLTDGTVTRCSGGTRTAHTSMSPRGIESAFMPCPVEPSSETGLLGENRSPMCELRLSASPSPRFALRTPSPLGPLSVPSSLEDPDPNPQIGERELGSVAGCRLLLASDGAYEPFHDCALGRSSGRRSLGRVGRGRYGQSWTWLPGGRPDGRTTPPSSSPACPTGRAWVVAGPVRCALWSAGAGVLRRTGRSRSIRQPWTRPCAMHSPRQVSGHTAPSRCPGSRTGVAGAHPGLALIQQMSPERPTRSRVGRATLARFAQSGQEPVCHRIPVITTPPGGVIVVTALLLPVVIVLMLFGLDAFESFLFPRHTDRPQADAGEPRKTL
jgi:hypothetical protein